MKYMYCPDKIIEVRGIVLKKRQSIDAFEYHYSTNEDFHGYISISIDNQVINLYEYVDDLKLSSKFIAHDFFDLIAKKRESMFME